MISGFYTGAINVSYFGMDACYSGYGDYCSIVGILGVDFSFET